MRLENFKVSDMNKLSGENMTYIVGGNCAKRSGETSGNDGICYSNDYIDSDGIHLSLHGGDWSEERLRREEQC